MGNEFHASALLRIKECPASSGLIEDLDLPEIESGDASEGTTMHGYIADCMNGNPLEWKLITLEQNRVINKCMEWLKAMVPDVLNGEPDQTLVEQRMTLDDNSATLVGTPDLVLIKGDRAMLVDWKFGRIPVDQATDNIQLAAYAVLVHESYPNVRHISAFVLQPRLGNHTVMYTYRQFTKMRENIFNVIYKTFVKRKTFNPSPDTCRYCPALRACPAVRDILGIKIADRQSAVAPTREDAAIWWDAAALADKWATAVRQAVRGIIEQAAEQGDHTPGMEIKSRRGRQRVANIDDLWERLDGILDSGEFLGACTVSLPSLSEAYCLRHGVTIKDARQKVEEIGGDAIHRGPGTQIIQRKKEG